MLPGCCLAAARLPCGYSALRWRPEAAHELTAAVTTSSWCAASPTCMALLCRLWLAQVKQLLKGSKELLAKYEQTLLGERASRVGCCGQAGSWGGGIQQHRACRSRCWSSRQRRTVSSARTTSQFYSIPSLPPSQPLTHPPPPESYVDDNKRAKWCPSVPHCGHAIRCKELHCEVHACGLRLLGPGRGCAHREGLLRASGGSQMDLSA